MFFRAHQLPLFGLMVCAFASPALRAETGDAENSHDYPGFTRVPGYVISDYAEDNPVDYDFVVARPLPIDADHVETVTARGHRYIIQYDLGPGGKPSMLIQTQQYFEKLASGIGFTLEKSGAVGDVSETFHLEKEGREVWVRLVPTTTSYVLTILEVKGAAAVAAIPEAPKAEAKAAPPTPTPEPPAPAPEPPPPVKVPAVASVPIAPPGEVAASESVKPVAPEPTSASTEDDSFYVALMKSGRVVLPLAFMPGKPDLDADSQPVIDRIVAMMQRHPDLVLNIEGHTDNTGDPKSNQALSKQRATTVRGLLESADIDKSRLAAIGFGGTEPIADEGTREGRLRNRRIELVVRKESPPKPRTTPTVSAPPVVKASTPKVTPNIETPKKDTPFHAAAPDGVNYYPSTGGSSTTSGK